MTSGQIFRHNSRLNSCLNSGLSSTLPAKDVASAHWLLRVLPDFGIVQLDGRRTASILAQFEQLIDIPLVRWSSIAQFSGYAELLSDALDLPSSDHVYLQHRLRAWAEKGGVLWILVAGDDIPCEQLIQLLRYRPLSRSGQFAIRILLKVADNKCNDKSFAPLADVIHERVGDPLPVKHRSFNHSTIKVFAPYIFIFFLSAASITATLYMASQEKSALAKAGVTERVLPSAEPESHSVEALLSAQSISEKKAPTIDALEIDALEIDALEINALEINSPDSQAEARALSEKSEVIGMIAQWSRAWQQQNIDEYFSMYSHGYSVNQHMSPNEWRIWRTARLKKPVWISIEIGPVTIERKTDGLFNGELKEELHATFWQLYRSPGYQDDTLKTLVLRREAGVWKIADEINEEVRPLSDE